MMSPVSTDTATAPRIRQYEQVHRRTVFNPLVNFTRKRTVPQWHAPSISTGSGFCIAKLSKSLNLESLPRPVRTESTIGQKNSCARFASCQLYPESGYVQCACLGSKDDGLAFAPVLIKNLHAVFSFDEAHFFSSTIDYQSGEAVGLRISLHRYSMKSRSPLFPSGSHCTGTTAGAPLSLIKTTRNFAGWVLLAFRSMT